MNPVLDLLNDLKTITATPGRGCTRIAYTHYEDEAHDLVWDRLAGGPLVRLCDAAGNMFVVPEWAVGGDGVVLVGSHLDTVIEGGWLDGALGVAVAAHVVRTLADPARRGLPVGLVVFRDEEGVRFSTGLFGSKVFAGLCTEADLAASDRRGTRVGDVVLDRAGCLAYQPPVRVAAYLECHIEQGLRLVERRRRIGVVTGMVGIRRFELTGEGVANHAGTTEMHRRVDALVPLASVVSRLPQLVEGLEDAVITCGRIAAHPGAPNIVPGRASAVVEIRARDTPTLERIEGGLRSMVATLVPPTPHTRRAALRLSLLTDVAPTRTDPVLADALGTILDQRRQPSEPLTSMAGHDAQHAARVCPAGMFFIPTIDGISHAPGENSREEDIELAAEIMLAWAEACTTRAADNR